MSKVRITQKELKRGFYYIYQCGYCGFIPTAEPDFYTCGVYGWNADVYKIDDNTIIVTGYRPFGRRLPKEVLDTFKNEKEVIAKRTKDWSKRIYRETLVMQNLLDKIKD